MRTAQGRALFGGVAAQTFRPLHYPMTSAIGLGILTAGHRHGWPVAAGGSASITTALAAMLTDLGGKIETGVPIQAASYRRPTPPCSTWPRNRSQPSSPTGYRPESSVPTAVFAASPARSKWTSPSRVGFRGQTRTPAAPGPCTWAAAHWDTGVLAMSDVLLRMVGRHSRA